MRLDTPIDYDSFQCMRPICLPTQDTVFPDFLDCVVAGWGVTQAAYDGKKHVRFN